MIVRFNSGSMPAGRKPALPEFRQTGANNVKLFLLLAAEEACVCFVSLSGLDIFLASETANMPLLLPRAPKRSQVAAKKAAFSLPFFITTFVRPL